MRAKIQRSMQCLKCGRRRSNSFKFEADAVLGNVRAFRCDICGVHPHVVCMPGERKERPTGGARR